MQAEIAGKSNETQIEVEDQFLEIAALGRTTMIQLREVLEFLRDNHAPKKLFTPEESFERHFLKRLNELEFQLKISLPPWPSIPTIGKPIWSGFLQEFFAEAATNILKYAPRHSVVSVWYETPHDGIATITIQNAIPQPERRSYASPMSSNMGLEALKNSAADLGGKVSTSMVNNLWLLQLSFPKE